MTRVGPASADMSGKVVLITGGSKGIGVGCARAFAAAGASVVIAARDRSAGEAAAEQVTALGIGGCRFEQADVADLGQLADLIDGTVDRDGRLDTLVNNAVLYPGWMAVDDVGADLLGAALQVNIASYFVGCQRALPHLRRTKGTIVNMGSLAGELGQWHDSLYSTTKGAISSMTRALAIEEAPNHVRVNAILPGSIISDTRLKAVAKVKKADEFEWFIDHWQWMGRSGTADEVGNAALFLASEMSSFCTGISLIVSGGLEIGYGVKTPYPDFGTAQDL